MLNARSNSNVLIRKGPLKAIISIVALWSFLFNIVCFDVAWAVRVPSESSRVDSNGADSPGFPRMDLTVDNVSIPLGFGEIKNTFRGTNGKTIIHILDAHCNYSAQHAVAGIVDHLSNNYNIDTIFLEGGSGDYDLSLFTNIRDSEMRYKISDYFVKEGRINGPEFYAINNPDKIKLFGIEEEDLYSKNLNIYRSSIPLKEDIDKYLDTFSGAIANLKLKVYSPELKELDERIKEAEKDKLNFKGYVLYLNDRAQNSGIPVSDYKTIGALQDVLKDEESIDFKEANRERDLLITKLNSKLSRKDMEDLTNRSLQFKAAALSSEEFYDYLFMKARFASVDFNMLPNLLKYSEYVKRYELIDKSMLLKEVKDVEEKLFKYLAKTNDQRTLYRLHKNLSIIKGIFNISLIKEDFDYYNSHKDEFATKNFTDFLNTKGPLYGLTFKMDDRLMALDTYREKMEKFYECSLERDDAFLRNIESKLNAEKKNAAVLFTGGFHTGNISKLLRDKGYSYVEVMPRFQYSDQCPYFKLLAGKKTDMEDLLDKTASYDAGKSTIAIHTLFSMVPDLKDRNTVELEIQALRRLMAGESFTVITPRGCVVFSNAARQGAVEQFSVQYADTTVFANVFAALPEGVQANAQILDDSTMAWQRKGPEEEGPPEGPRKEGEGRRPPRLVTRVEVTRGSVAVAPRDEEGGPDYTAGSLVGPDQALSAIGEAGMPGARPILGVSRNGLGQTFIEVPGITVARQAPNRWDGWIDMMANSDKTFLEIGELYDGQPVMVNIPYSELMSGSLASTFFGQVGQTRAILEGAVRTFKIGNVTFNIFHDTAEGRARLKDAIGRFATTNGIDEASRSKRIVTFAYQKTGEARDGELEKNSYTVYLTGKEKETVAPVTTCGVTGLAILNYLHLMDKRAKDAKAVTIPQINSAVSAVARGIATLAGVPVSEDVLQAIAKKDTEGMLELLRSGLILVKIRPVDGSEIRALHEAEAEVLRAL